MNALQIENEQLKAEIKKLREQLCQSEKAANGATANETRIRRMMDFMADAMFQISLDGTILAINNRAVMLLGYDSAELVGKNVSSLTEHRRPEQVKNDIDKMQVNIPVIAQFPVMTKAGNELFCERRSVKLALADEVIIFTLLRDITQEIETQKALEAHRKELAILSERLSLLINNLPAPVLFIDPDERVIFINRSFNLINANAHEAPGKPLQHLLDAPLYQFVKPYVDRTLNGEARVQFDAPVKLRTGTEVVLEIVQIPHIVNGQVAGFIGLARDVTEERKLIADLQQSQRLQRETVELLQLIIDNMPSRIAYADKNQTIHFINRQYKNMNKQSDGQWVGSKIKDCNIPKGNEEVDRNFQLALKGEQRKFDYITRDSSGEISRIVDITYVPHIQDQEVVGVFNIARDVTDERKRELALREAQKLESLGLMAGGIAHDFNNLLVAILSQTQIAKFKLDSDHPAYRHIEKTERAANRASTLSNQMLAYSGRGKFEIKPVNFNELIESNLHLIESGMGRHIELNVNLDPHLPIIEADTAQMQQVVMNLLLNATQAIGNEPGYIKVTTELNILSQADTENWLLTGKSIKAGHYISVIIEDSGCGMSEQQAKKIFEPFFSTKDVGTGLGLSAVLGIMRGHNGSIRVDSKLGKGTQFHLLLPIAKVLTKKVLTTQKV